MSEDGIGSAVALLRTTFSLAASPVTLSSPRTSELAPDFADQSSFKEEKPSCSLQSPVSWKPSPEEVIMQDQWPLCIWIPFFFFFLLAACIVVQQLSSLRLSSAVAPFLSLTSLTPCNHAQDK